MDMIWLEVLKEAVTVIAGVIFAGVSTMGAFFIKRETDKIKRKTLEEDIAKYVRWAEQSPSFEEFTGKEKFQMVFSKATAKALEIGIPINESEIAILVESQVKTMKESEGEAIRKLVRAAVEKELSEKLPEDIENIDKEDIVEKIVNKESDDKNPVG